MIRALKQVTNIIFRYRALPVACYLLFAVCCLLPAPCAAQTVNFNNGWINHSLYYYKIKVANDNLYKLDSLLFARAGVPALDPNNLHFYQKGVELYAYISGAADGVLNKHDFILFYAEKNKGKDDSLLYAQPPFTVPFITNPYYSVINDTSAVFFTYDNSSPGKRLTLNTDTNYSSYPAAPYYMKQVNSTRYDYSFGPYNTVNQNDPRYVLGEGYFSSILGEPGNTYGNCYGANSSYAFNFTTSSAYTTGIAYATVCFSGANDIATTTIDHIIQVQAQGSSGNIIPLGTYSVSGYKSGRYTYPLNSGSFGTMGNITVSSLNNPFTGGIDNLLDVNYISVVYPQQFNMLGQTQEKIYLPYDASSVKSKLIISGLANHNSQPVLIDTTSGLITFMSATNLIDTVLVPNTGNTKFCFLSSMAAADTVLKITPINGTGTFVNYPILDSAFVIVSHPKLINPPSTGGQSGVMDYANFRHSGVGGGNYNVIVASVEDLYDQFGYGVERNPLAIKNFCGWLIANAATNHIRPPSNLFLIGKGVHAWECDTAWCPYVPAAVAAAGCLVPSFGNPSSDILLTQGLPGSSYYPEPAIPTGRIAAQTDADVKSYLSKAELYVVQDPDSLWRKRALHFIGGDSPSDQANFNAYMSVCKQIYDGTFIGGDVFSFYKTTTTPISTNTNDSVTLLINQGVSLMTFFGHGSPTGFDQNIDAPGAYNNSPKFPFIIANSCFTGDIFASNQVTNSEEWILAPNNKGSIGYIATTAEGVANELSTYTQELYRRFCYKNYGMPYGYCVKKDINYLISLNPLNAQDTLLQETCLEMTMEGDPAIKPNTIQKPDYTLSNMDVILNTKTYPDSIGIKIIMTNLGKGIDTTYTVKIVRQFPSGVDSTYYKKAKAPLYKDTLSFFIAMNYTQAVGQNCFTVNLNCLNTVSEININNNSTNPCIPLFILGSDIDPVWPYKYAIIPNIHNVTLEASTANPLAPSTKYLFQLDTSAGFSSPMLLNQTVTAPGGVVSLPVRLTLNKDSVVYFWRVAKDTTIPNWKQSSFQVINGKQGWEQAHFRQFNKDTYQYVQYDSANWRFNFANNVRTIQVTDGVTGPNVQYSQVQFFEDNAQQDLWTCAAGGWSIAVFDTISGSPIPSYSTSIAPTNTSGYPTWIGNAQNCICSIYSNNVTYDFGIQNQCLCSSSCDNNWERKMISFIASIPNGTPVLAYTGNGFYPGAYNPGNNPYSTAPTPALIAALQSIGSIKIDSLRDTTTLIIFGRKGMHPGQAKEVLSRSASQLVTLIDTLETHFDNGYIASEIIGPARQSDTAWKSLHWHYELPARISPTSTLVPNVATDIIVIQVIGIDVNGVKTTLANFTRDSLDVLDLSHYTNQIPGKFFPYIQLIAYEQDNHVHRPPQLKRWQVIYDPAPECALYPTGGYTVANTTVAEGQTYQVVMPIKNIGAVPFPDSLVINYYVEDVNRVTHNFSQTKPKGFAPGAVMLATFTVNTIGLGGNNIFGIDVNTPGKPKYQNEEYHFNNIAQFGFNVTTDKINPVLDVTFDGTHILNGDIVSAKPDVLISLKDENKFLALNDTGNFAIYVSPTPNAAATQRVYFNNTNLLQFTPAVLPNNSCKINYKPILGQDGLYSLDVKATDRSSNASGQVDYKIQYEVINKPMITEVLNYPNPFSTSTKFVFTITGSEVPQTLKIQIMTITGKVVKEITREELGYLHIGRNISEYAWDGTDQYGGKLANGVYFYHVVTRLNGSDVEHMNTSADEFFKKGIGKMVIMR